MFDKSKRMQTFIFQSSFVVLIISNIEMYLYVSCEYEFVCFFSCINLQDSRTDENDKRFEELCRVFANSYDNFLQIAFTIPME